VNALLIVVAGSVARRRRWYVARVESTLALWSGWITVALIVSAALVPIVQRLREGKRAAPDSPATRGHVVLGISAALLAFGHTLSALMSLGSERATAGGNLAIVPGCVAFLIVVAHVGLGLQLRDVKLRDRARKRRNHLATAIAITIAGGVHVGALVTAVQNRP
jgi:hypothetical protein